MRFCFPAASAADHQATPPTLVSGLSSSPSSHSDGDASAVLALLSLYAAVMTTPTRTDETDRTLFVGNLESRVREEILYELFLQAGPVTKVTVCKDKDGKPKTFGFVCFKHTESVPYAIALLNGIRLYGRPIKVQYRFGSSYCPELSNYCQNIEHDIHSLPYRNAEPYSRTSSSSSLFQMNGSLQHGYSAFQNVMSYFIAQEGMTYSPMEQEFPYCQMLTPQPHLSFSVSPYLTPEQSSFVCAYPDPKNHTQYLVKKCVSKRKRHRETSDSDSSMENEGKKTKRK
uniref:Splicing regulator RBM11 n=1 Tax=Salvator merianae TaxID=96440 RepID=A0A8D0B5A7_SALMN